MKNINNCFFGLSKEEGYKLYNEIRFFLDRMDKSLPFCLFFISPFSNVKINFIKEIMKDESSFTKSQINTLRILSLHDDFYKNLEIDLDKLNKYNIGFIFGFYIKYSNLSVNIIDDLIEKYDTTDDNELKFYIKALLSYFYIEESNFPLAEKHLKSCINYINNNNTSDHTKITIYYLCGQLTKSIHTSFIVSSEEYYKLALELSRKNGFSISTTACLDKLSKHYYYSGELNKAIPLCEEAFSISNDLSINELKYTFNRLLGLYQIDNGKIEEGINLINKAFDSLNQIDTYLPIHHVKFYSSVGYAHFMLGNFKKSIEFYYNSLEHLTKINNAAFINDEIAEICDNIASGYKLLGEIDNAIYFTELSINFLNNNINGHKINTVYDLFRQNIQLGFLYGFYKKDYANALKAYNQALKFPQSKDYIKRGRFIVLETYIKMNSLSKNEIIDRFKESINILEETGGNNLYVKSIIMEFNFILSSLFNEDKELFMEEASKLACNFSLKNYYDFFLNHHIKNTSYSCSSISKHTALINLISVVSNEKQKSSHRLTKSVESNFVKEFICTVNKHSEEKELFNDSFNMFKNFFSASSFIVSNYSGENGFKTFISYDHSIKCDCDSLESRFRELVDMPPYKIKDKLDSYDIITSNNENDVFKSLILYYVFDEISMTYYYFALMNPPNSHWSFNNDDAKLALTLINYLLVKLKHIQYLQYFKTKTYTDSLTGLYNHEYFWNVIDDMIDDYKKKGNRFKMIFIDLNNFKKINDNFGHTVGDMALKTFASSLTRAISPIKEIIRFGGDEFICLIPSTHVDKAEDLINRIHSEANKSYVSVNHHKVFVEFAYGMLEFNSTFRGAKDFFSEVDKLMYLNKNGKR